ncbi:MAG: glycosyltransferase [Planctomycetota bacterium]|nr:MAG: glycosyltransferase [Planctomycetota bacterium]
MAKCPNKPVISIIVVVDKRDGKWLAKCINSVASQYYANWELILVNSASQKSSQIRLVSTWTSQDSRVRAFCLKHNSTMAEATNSAIRQARGKFIGFLDGDDELTADALTWIIWTINKHPQARWFYSDEDKISKDERCHSPYFKPDFSPELLLSNMYTQHFIIYSADALSEIGGLRELDSGQEHDLSLRLSEVIPREQIVHIPRVLYHCREVTGSLGTKQKPSMGAQKVVAEALKRRNLRADVSLHKLCPTLYQIALQPSHFPKVSIIIPTRNALDLLQRCVHSIREYTNYPNYEIIVVDNQSNDLKVTEYLAAESSQRHVKVLQYNNDFNHSAMNNIAVSSVKSEFVVFMNNDVEIVSDNWLEQLVATAQIDESVGTVGGLLLYPDGKVQHGGMLLGILGLAGHAHKRMESNSAGYFGRLYAFQEMSGITAALALVRRAAFEFVGGFNSERYPTSYNDVDLCIRLRKEGFRCLYNPMVRAIHYEAKTRPITADELHYQERLMADHSEILGNDPFYNPNLALDNEQFSGFRRFPVEDQIPELADIPRGER